MAKKAQRRRQKTYEPSRFLTGALLGFTCLGLVFALIGMRILMHPSLYLERAREVPVEIVAILDKNTMQARRASFLKLAALNAEGERVVYYNSYARLRWPYRPRQVVEGYIDDASGRIETPLTLYGGSRLGGGLFFGLGSLAAFLCGAVFVYDIRNRIRVRRLGDR
ncbi:hypothetical protein [Celeribacter naphthalenivorans]|uniref:hypothetical protein n=1 Tax=Celeribacter naphthalenivorans TaxID=1614694 RepID=UPI001CF9F1B3|nr:hypothetical protein [Celeribacter naphthalenivorans]